MNSNESFAIGLATSLVVTEVSAVAWVTRTPNELPGWIEWTLPGGSGTVKLPPDWKITASDSIGSFEAAGPDGLAIHMGVGGNVAEPWTIYAMAAPYGALVAPLSDPANAVVNLAGQWSRISQYKTGFGFRLDRILSNVPVAGRVGGRAALLRYDWTKTAWFRGTPMRGYGYLECLPGLPGTWSYQAYYAEGPRETFDQAVPMLLAIVQSWRVNPAIVRENGQRLVDAQNLAFQVFEQYMREMSDRRDASRAAYLGNLTS